MAARGPGPSLLALCLVLCAHALWSRPVGAVQFDVAQTLQGGIGFTTVLTFGPEDPDPGSTGDGCVYAVEGFEGEVRRICFDATKSVVSNAVVIDLNGPGLAQSVLGISFDPTSDSATVLELYLAYSDDASAPFNGKIARAVSLDGGQSYAVDEDFITGLPRSTFDHGTNGLDFGPDGCLYIAQANNSNMGFDADFAESRLSSAVLRACFKDGSGGILSGFDRNCGAANTQESCDVEVYASGLRNPFDLEWHANGSLYATDNDANQNFRLHCGNEANAFGCACLEPPFDPVGDELNRIEAGAYYGSPNPYLANPQALQCQGGDDPGDACTVPADCTGGGTCEDLSGLCTDGVCADPVHCFYYAEWLTPLPGEDPNGRYREPIAQVDAQLDGLIEYRAPFDTIFAGGFCSDWDGDLIATGAPGPLRRFRPSADGLSASDEGGVNLVGPEGLDVVVGPDGAVYVADLLGGQVAFLSPVEQADPAQPDFFRHCDVSQETGSWDLPLPPSALPAARPDATVATLEIGGLPYVFVFDGSSEVLRFDPGADSWSSSSDPGTPGAPPDPPFPLTGPPPADHRSAVSLNGSTYLIGGLHPFTSTTWSYDGVSDPAGSARSAIGCSASPSCAEALAVGGVAAGAIGGHIYSAGGLCDPIGPGAASCTCNGLVGGCNGQNTDRAFRYDPGTDVWNEIAPLPTAVDHGAAVGFEGEFYVFGGRQCGSHVVCEGRSEVQIYDPASDSWRSGAPVPEGCSGMGRAVVLNRRIYIVGGEGGVCTGTTVQEYTPHTDTWRAVSSLPDAHAGSAPVALGDPSDGVPDSVLLAGGAPGDAHTHRLSLGCEECERIALPECATAAACDDANSCTDDVCVAGVCGHIAWPDLDQDGVCDALDNCPALPNAGQDDLGGVGAGSEPDGIGDACQCGDVDDSGEVSGADAILLRRVLVGEAVLSAAGSDKCAAIGAPDSCDLVDAVVLRRALETPALLPGVAQGCRAWLGP